MSIINVPTEKSVEGVVGTSSGNQRVVMTSAFNGTQLTHSEKSVEVMCEDGSGNKQRCVAVMHFEDSESSPIPSQVGNAEKFLKTNGTSLIWDNALQNSSSVSLALGIEGEVTESGGVAVGFGSEVNGQGGVSIGTSAQGGGDGSICIGTMAKDNGQNSNTVIGTSATSSGTGATVIGNGAIASSAGSVVLGSGASATEAGIFVVALSTNGYSSTSYKVLESNGQICAARFATLPSVNGNYRLRLTVNNGVATYSWVTE